MKFKVSYYDFDTDKYIKQDFDRINFYSNGELYLYSLNPYKCHKVVISNSKISFDQDNDRMNMRIKGYQYLGEGNYKITETIIENVRED